LKKSKRVRNPLDGVVEPARPQANFSESPDKARALAAVKRVVGDFVAAR
jgi:hypothetical protein